VGKKIRTAQQQKIPYMLVLGDREVESGEVNVRRRDGSQESRSLDAFAADLLAEIAERRLPD
jgi:threonyl-tRNA synthetase